MQEREGGGVMLAGGPELSAEDGGAVKTPSSPWFPSLSSKVGQAAAAAATKSPLS